MLLTAFQSSEREPRMPSRRSATSSPSTRSSSPGTATICPRSPTGNGEDMPRRLEAPVQRKLTTSERLAQQSDSHSKHEICLVMQGCHPHIRWSQTRKPGRIKRIEPTENLN